MQYLTFVTPKRDASYKITLNFKNLYIEFFDNQFKMRRLQEILKLVTHFSKMNSLDFKDAC